MTSRYRFAVALSLAVLCLGGDIFIAVADDPGDDSGKPSATHVADAPPTSPDQALQDAANAFSAYRDQLSVTGYSSYAIEHGTLIFYIHSASPSDRSEVDRISSEFEVPVEIRETPLPRNHLIARLQRLLPALNDVPQYVSIGPSRDRQSLVIGIDGAISAGLRASFVELLSDDFPGITLTFHHQSRSAANPEL